MDTINVTPDATNDAPDVQPELTPDAAPAPDVTPEVTEPTPAVNPPAQFNPLNVKDLRTMTDYTVTVGTLAGTVIPANTQVFATEVSLDGTWYRGFAVPVGIVAFPKSIFPVVVRAMSIRDERALIKDIRAHIEKSDAFVNYVQTLDALALTATTPALLAFFRQFAGLLTTLTTDIEKESDALRLRFLWIYLSQVSNDLGGTLAGAKKLNPLIFSTTAAAVKVETVATNDAAVVDATATTAATGDADATNDESTVGAQAPAEPATGAADATNEPAPGQLLSAADAARELALNETHKSLIDLLNPDSPTELTVDNNLFTPELTADEKLLTIDEIPVDAKKTRAGGRRR